MRKLRPERQQPCLLPPVRCPPPPPPQAHAHEPLLLSPPVQFQGEPSEWWSLFQEFGWWVGTRVCSERDWPSQLNAGDSTRLCMGGETCLQTLGAQQGLKHLSTLSALALVYTGVQVCRGLLQWIRGRWVGRRAVSF